MSIFKRHLSRRGKGSEFDGITSCVFTSTKGLMALCETPGGRLFDKRTTWPALAAFGHRSGGRIFAHANALAHFARYGLRLINRPFVLVTGDSDRTTSEAAVGGDIIEKIANHPNLITWFVQNLDHNHPKMVLLPIGLDYHTVALRREKFWGPSSSPHAQEDLLRTVRALGRPLADRQAKSYSNWHFYLDRGGRAEAKAALPEASIFYEPNRVSRWESWTNNTEFFFTASPRGVGIDCHRTWEAILLGSAPIVPVMSINPLFKDLPVVVVDDWAAVTPKFLAAEKTRILSETFNFAPLLINYWRRRFNGYDLPQMNLGFQEFMALGPSDLDEIAKDWSG